MGSEQDFLRQLLETFKIELDERLESLNKALLELESGGVRQDLVDQIFRDAHSLKGAARAVEIPEMESVAHAMEALLADVKRGRALTKELFSLLYKTIDFFNTAMETRLGGGSMAEAEVKAWVQRIDKAREGEQESVAPKKPGRARKPAAAPVAPQAESGEATRPPAEPPAPEPPVAAAVPPLAASDSAMPVAAMGAPEPPRGGGDRRAGPEDRRKRDRRLDDALLAKETIRVNTSNLDALLAQAGELLITKIKLSQLQDEIVELSVTSTQLEKQLVEIRRTLKSVTNGAPFSRVVDGAQERARSLSRKVKRFSKEFVSDTLRLHTLTRELQEGIKIIRMLPVGLVFDHFYRTVRDLCEVRKKQVAMTTEGGECALDKKLIEALKDPLMHLIRNAVDHGIEGPEARVAKGKPPQGKVHVSARLKGDTAIITVEDDGTGIDVGAVKQKSIKKGFLSAEDAEMLSQREIIGYIFKPGFSTAPIIDDISGRGIGLDVVHTAVEKMHGTIDVQSELGVGTKFIMQLPLTVSTFQGLLVKAGGQAFVLPINSVEKILRSAAVDVKRLGSAETIQIDGFPLQVARLTSLLGMNETSKSTPDRHTVVVVSSAEKRLALIVEGLLGEQEIILKNLSRPLLRVRNFAGATILGNGQIVMILNVVDLIGGTAHAHVPAKVHVERKPASVKRRKTVLVVDDSITTRMLEKNILEAAGYRVLLATDGAEALGVLQGEAVDLVLSDVEMPNLDGFNLTKKIRASAQLKDMPIILVTSLASPEDKSRGIDAGADAYVVKSSFDQGKLLQTIEQLTD